MELEIAKKWVAEFFAEGRKPSSITADEIHGILLVLDIKKIDFAKLLQVAKSSMTKYLAASLRPTKPLIQLMFVYLAAELTTPGIATVLLKESSVLIFGLRLTVPAPKYVLDAVA